MASPSAPSLSVCSLSAGDLWSKESRRRSESRNGRSRRRQVALRLTRGSQGPQKGWGLTERKIPSDVNAQEPSAAWEQKRALVATPQSSPCCSGSVCPCRAGTRNRGTFSIHVFHGRRRRWKSSSPPGPWLSLFAVLAGFVCLFCF